MLRGFVLLVLAAALLPAQESGCLLEVVAGGGTSFSGDGGPAQLAEFDHPEDAVARPDGSIYIADTGNGRVRWISPDGIVTTILRTPEPARIAVSPEGDLFVFDRAQRRIVRRLTNGLVRTVLADAGLGAEVGIDAGPGPTLYLADAENGRVLRLERSGRLETVADSSLGATAISDLVYGPDGALYVADGIRRQMLRIAADGAVTQFGQFPGREPSFIIGVVQPFPSDGFSAIDKPRLAVDAQGELIATVGAPLVVDRFTFDADNSIPGIQSVVAYRFSTTGQASAIIADALDDLAAVEWLPDGRLLFTSAGRDQAVALTIGGNAYEPVAGVASTGASGDGGAATEARLRAPQSVAALSSGEIYVGDEGRVRVIGADGVIRASDFSAPAAYLASDVDGGALYLSDGPTVRRRDPGGAVTVVAEADVCPRETCGVLSPAPIGGVESEVELGRIAVATNGDLWIAERGAGSLRRLRRVTPSGDVSRPFGPFRPFANFLRGFGGLDVGVDLDGTVVHIDRNHLHRFDAEVGDWSEIEGAAGSTGDGVRHAVRDGEGNTYFAVDGRVLRLTPEGPLNTVAGLGEDSPLVRPEALALAPGGDLLIADAAAGLVLRLREPEACDRTVRPQIYSSGVRNAASGGGGFPRIVPASRFDPVAAGLIAFGPIAPQPNAAPGMLASVYGLRLGPAEAAVADDSLRVPTELGGVSATVDGKPAGVLFASEGQINLVLPFDAPESGDVDLVVTVDGVASEPYPLRMTAAHPRVFAVLNADGTLNSEENPAAAGEEVSLLVSGLGRPTVEADALAISDDVLSWSTQRVSITVSSGDENTPDSIVDPLWARSRPGEIASVVEVRFRVPPGAQTLPDTAFGSIMRVSSDAFGTSSAGWFRLYVSQP